MCERGRLPALDGVRGIAILFVLVGHSSEQLAPLASAGVTVFFVLSVYLITEILLAEHACSSRIHLRRCYARRFTRLAPPLVFMLAVMGLVLGSNWVQVLVPAAWLMNYAKYLGIRDVEPAFGHTWSLALEEQFYLVWPFVLLMLLRSRRPVATLTCIVAALTLWRAGLTVTGNLGYAYAALEAGGVPILAGGLVALARFRVPANRSAVSAGPMVAITAPLGFVNDVAWLVTPLLVTPVAISLIASARGARWLAWRPLAFCGLASYSIYLWHRPFAWAVFGSSTPAAIAMGAVAGVVGYIAVERPLMRMRSQRQIQAIGSPAQTSYTLGHGPRNVTDSTVEEEGNSGSPAGHPALSSSPFSLRYQSGP